MLDTEAPDGEEKPTGLRPVAEPFPKAVERSHRRQMRKKVMVPTENTGFKGPSFLSSSKDLTDTCSCKF